MKVNKKDIITIAEVVIEVAKTVLKHLNEKNQK